MNNIIEVKNLKKYYKNTKAVNDISFTVKEGSLFAFLGENGAGKSTTINVLCTVLTKTEGSVVIGGYDLDKNPNAIKGIIGIVFQGSVLDDRLSVIENLETRCAYYGLDKSQREERIKYIVDVLQLKEILKQKYSSLSGGQRRRVDIARALINSPKILFLDEPTTGLDPKTRMMVWDIINKLRTECGLTVFLTTHYMEETKDADEVVILDHGNIVAHDTPNNLKIKYTTNKFIWYVEKNEANDELLKKYNYEFQYDVDSYRFNFNNGKDIASFIYNEQDKVIDYEIAKGNMDDVFINITGKKLGD